MVMQYWCAAMLRLYIICLTMWINNNRRHLRSAAHYDMTVPRTRLMRYGPRSFAVSGPVLWNSLPAAVRDPALTVPQFLRRLKTELFSRAYWLSFQRLVMAFALRLREQQEPYHHHHHNLEETYKQMSSPVIKSSVRKISGCKIPE